MQGMLWYSSLLAQAICLFALVRRRLAHRYPVFSVFLAFGLAHSAYVLYSLHAGGLDRDAACYPWVLAALYGALAIEACVAQTRHFPSLFSFAIGGIVIFAVLSAAVAGAIAFVGTEILTGRGPVMLLAAAGCVLVFLSTAYFGTFPVTMRPNVRWHVLILEILLASQAVATGLGSVESAGCRLAAPVLAAAAQLACCLMWTVKLVPSGECYMPLSEIPAEVLARLMAGDRAAPEQPSCRLPGRNGSCHSSGPACWEPEPAPPQADPGA